MQIDSFVLLLEVYPRARLLFLARRGHGTGALYSDRETFSKHMTSLCARRPFGTLRTPTGSPTIRDGR